MGKFKSCEVREHKEKLHELGRKEDLKMLFQSVERLAACHTAERVTAQVEVILSKWAVVKGQFLSPQ